ncbi:hypothetical protein UFOVP685_39 [uncultured Caudovirales phage]|uniref:Uncharacterized protein n=1 Tax=uncultured Caudovirales phage TaxID=2100421 RepID=A0A6J5MXG3_9CAUD|nr:hypothetical protein UFOVP590_45 [uncultured Caudovirales phage]CAB4157654.1 hypothetical protein UFOVP685_39 [uncultured Caudovirales phage]CAB5225328.1 hypothetical protein UFOVP750_13 [uncultured Caudovirales phage]
MIETMGYAFGYINDILRIINPFLFMGATCCWVGLYWQISKEMSRNILRQYCIESQIDYIVSGGIEQEYVDHLRQIYTGFEDKK